MCVDQEDPIRGLPTPEWEMIQKGNRVGVNFVYQTRTDYRNPRLEAPLGESMFIYLESNIPGCVNGALVEIPMEVQSKGVDSIGATFDENFDPEIGGREFYIEATNITKIISGE